jgi:valyl-tRNA synthetase
MIMDGLEFTGKVPLRRVYIHALVRDEHGQKMSKSKGNIIDPLDLIDRYGADAVRFTLAALAAQGRDIKLAEARVEGNRNFATKLWNAARFCQMNECKPVEGFDPVSLKNGVNRWVVGRLAATIQAVDQAMAAYRFNDAANALYHCVWGEFCDWYLEFTKPIFQSGGDATKAETRATTAWVLGQLLHLLHPFMPFLTEELWEQVGLAGSGRLISADWPVIDPKAIDAEATADLDWVIRLVGEVRALRIEMNVPPAAQVALILRDANAKTADRLLPISDDLARRTRNYILEERRRFPAARKHAFLFVANGGAPLSLRGLNKVFGVLSAKHPELMGIFPHLFRHTNNHNFSKLADEVGMDPEKEKKTRSQIMGWSETSGTAETYTRREIERQAREASLQLQNKMVKPRNDSQ